MNRIDFTTVIVYQENITESELQKICDNYPCCISPVHDKDIYTTDSGNHAIGEIKKAHWHVVFQKKLSVQERKTFNRSVGLSDGFIHQIVRSNEGILQYLTHETEKAIAQGKHIYDKNDIYYTDMWQDVEEQLYPHKDYLYELMDIVIGEHITNYYQFATRLLREENKELVYYAWKYESRVKHLVETREEYDKIQDLTAKNNRKDEEIKQLKEYIEELKEGTPYEKDVKELEMIIAELEAEIHNKDVKIKKLEKEIQELLKYVK